MANEFVTSLEDYAAKVAGVNALDAAINAGLHVDESWTAIKGRVAFILEKNKDVKNRTLEPVVMWLDGYLAGLHYASNNPVVEDKDHEWGESPDA